MLSGKNIHSLIVVVVLRNPTVFRIVHYPLSVVKGWKDQKPDLVLIHVRECV
jgi:hypothetical protein